MLEYHRIDVSEGGDTNKTDGLHECIIFRFQQKVSDDCHDMTQKFMSFDDTVIVNVKRHNCIIS